MHIRPKTTPRGLPLLPALLVAAALVPGVARAKEEDGPRRKVHVIQQRPFLHALRAEVVPEFGYTINESMYRYLQVAGTARFHITEDWAIGGTYGHYFADTTSTFDEVQDDFALFPEKQMINWFAGGEVSWSPLYGKFVLFRSGIVHWDAFLTAGAGVTNTGADNIRITGTFGLGGRIYLTRWLTLNVELKDHVYKEEFKAGDEIINNLVLHAGLGVFVPFGWEYQYPK